MGTHAAQPENHCPLTTSLSGSGHGSGSRDLGTVRWRGLHGAFGVVNGGLVFYWGVEMVLSFAGHSPSGPPGTHGQQHHYEPSPSAALLTLLPQGAPWPLLRISVSLRPTVLKELVLSSQKAFSTYIASSICLRTTGNNLTVQCGRFFKQSQRSREEAEGLLGRGVGVGVPVSLLKELCLRGHQRSHCRLPSHSADCLVNPVTLMLLSRRIIQTSAKMVRNAELEGAPAAREGGGGHETTKIIHTHRQGLGPHS